LSGTVRQTFALRIGQKTHRETGVEGGDGDLVSVDGEKCPPGAAADFKKIIPPAADASSAGFSFSKKVAIAACTYKTAMKCKF
jgi:hypothetical protein